MTLYFAGLISGVFLAIGGIVAAIVFAALHERYAQIRYRERQRNIEAALGPLVYPTPDKMRHHDRKPAA